jgi:hypothetical protein
MARPPKELRDLEKQFHTTLIAVRDLDVRANELGVKDIGKAAEAAHNTLIDCKLARSGEDAPLKVWIYVDTRKQVGDKDHLKVFASDDAANAWFAKHDPEGVAFEYPVSEGVVQQ